MNLSLFLISIMPIKIIETRVKTINQKKRGEKTIFLSKT